MLLKSISFIRTVFLVKTSKPIFTHLMVYRYPRETNQWKNNEINSSIFKTDGIIQKVVEILILQNYSNSLSPKHKFFQMSIIKKRVEVGWFVFCEKLLIWDIYFYNLPPFSGQTWWLETVQDFLIKLGIKPRMHLWEISILSLNSVIVGPTKIMNRTDKNWAHF